MLTNTPSRNQPGARAESEALAFLQQQGLTLLCRNFRCKAGEIDLIMRDGEFIVFVEVRLRNNRRFVSGFESVDFRKQQKISRTALVFLQKYKLLDASPCRFDIVSLKHKDNGAGACKPCTDQPAHAEIDWIRDAFQPG